ncbi:MAG: chemotaxis protein CheX [Spirochaetes bacterium]|nr:chemotaxis protein CheX [Spirochaetota bacterium]
MALIDSYEQYAKLIVRSVDHIFKNFLKDNTIEEVLESQSSKGDPTVSIGISGSIKGELIISMPQSTLENITKFFFKNASARTIKKHYEEVAGEIANLITGTFANQLQFLNHTVRLTPPEFNEEITTRTLYDNVNLSFISHFGGFDVDLYYRHER